VKRWAKILILVVAVLILAIASIPLFVNANTFRPAIERELASALGRSVQFGELSLSPFSGSLVAKDLSVAEDSGFSAAPFLTAKELRVGVSLHRLVFSHQIEVRSFQIEAPKINLIRAPNGTWNFSSLGHRATSGGTSKSLQQGLPDLSVDRIVIDDGRVAITTLPVEGEPSVFEHVDLTARDFSFASQFPFELSANLPAGGTISVKGHAGPINREDVATSPAEAQIVVKNLDPVASGFLHPDTGVALVADFDMHAASDGQALITSGTIHIEKLKLRKGATPSPKPVDVVYSGTHRLKDNSGQIEDATVKIGDAAIHVTGTYEPVAPRAGESSNAATVDDPLLNLKLAGQGLPIDELHPLMAAAAVRLPNGAVLKGGTLSINLAISGTVKSLVIAGPIALDNTRLVGFDVGSKIHGIAALSGTKTGDTTEFEKLRATVRVTNSGVVADKIYAVIPAVGELTGSGTVSAADQLDFNLIAKLASAKGLGKVGAGLLSALNGSGESSGVPLRITGTPDDPIITADVGSIFQKKTRSFSAIFGKKK
jgi:AsmA protein